MSNDLIKSAVQIKVKTANECICRMKVDEYICNTIISMFGFVLQGKVLLK
jgi:hypothetical protein